MLGDNRSIVPGHRHNKVDQIVYIYIHTQSHMCIHICIHTQRLQSIMDNALESVTASAFG